MSVLLKKEVFEGISPKELAEQIEAKKKCREKLPTWFNTANIYYPNKLHIEQTSSEITAQYKAEIINGKSLLDLTGGFGVDSFFFSEKTACVWHCEINQKLSEIAGYNFKVLGKKNIETVTKNGFDILKESNQNFDWIYVDPSRRNEIKEKVFLLTDCIPNVPTHLTFLLEKSKHILIKTSPLLDFSIGIKELRFVKEIHVVAVKNEVKELLWVIEKGYSGKVHIKTINFGNSGEEIFAFYMSNEKEAVPDLGVPSTYLYEPNVAILKSGAFKIITDRFPIKKLHRHTHLYTSETLIDFPGRRFKIEEAMPFNKKTAQKLKVQKANITIRNFPKSVSNLRKQLKIKDGGAVYLFFTKDMNENHVILRCSKV
ncbi:MAG: class I SAM-dependent methyltransferase [Bacteroidota bacterium]